ncbi:sulfurtransferase, partial [candidate division KSB1 bacterium 4484_87]
MFAPLEQMGFFGETTGFVIAFLIGIGFGFSLERAGFGNANKLAAQFYFRDMTVFKVMFTAIITAMIGIYLFNAFGWLDLDLIYINPTYLWPQIVGGLILGFGFIIGGYCPGTSVVASATGRLDGILFLLGVVFGIAVFAAVFPLFESFFYSGHLGDTFTLDDWLGIRPGIIVFAIVL